MGTSVVVELVKQFTANAPAEYVCPSSHVHHVLMTPFFYKVEDRMACFKYNRVPPRKGILINDSMAFFVTYVPAQDLYRMRAVYTDGKTLEITNVQDFGEVYFDCFHACVREAFGKIA